MIRSVYIVTQKLQPSTKSMKAALVIQEKHNRVQYIRKTIGLADEKEKSAEWHEQSETLAWDTWICSRMSRKTLRSSKRTYHCSFYTPNLAQDINWARVFWPRWTSSSSPLLPSGEMHRAALSQQQSYFLLCVFFSITPSTPT